MRLISESLFHLIQKAISDGDDLLAGHCNNSAKTWQECKDGKDSGGSFDPNDLCTGPLFAYLYEQLESIHTLATDAEVDGIESLPSATPDQLLQQLLHYVLDYQIYLAKIVREEAPMTVDSMAFYAEAMAGLTIRLHFTLKQGATIPQAWSKPLSQQNPKTLPQAYCDCGEPIVMGTRCITCCVSSLQAAEDSISSTKKHLPQLNQLNQLKYGKEI